MPQAAGITIAEAAPGSSSSTVRNRNLFCSEQLRDAELMRRMEGRMGALPSIQSKVTRASRPM